MSQAEHAIHLPATVWVAIIGVASAAITGIITFFSGRNASVAVLQTALVAGFKELNDQQTQKIADLSEEVKVMREELSKLKSELAAEQQRTESLRNLLRRHGIELPRDQVTSVVFSPYPESADANGACQGKL